MTAKHSFSILALVLTTSASSAEIPDLDTSGWAADPTEYGMTPREYIQAESRAFMANFVGRVGLNAFFHFEGLSTAEDTWVVSPNNDTIYSMAALNVRDGFTLVLPEVGERFLSVQIITEYQMTPFYLYGGGTRTFSSDDFDTDYVGLGVRIGTDGTDEDVAFVVNELQPQYAIEGADDTDDMPRPDLETMQAVRAAMMVEYDKLSDTFDTMRETTDQVDDWERFTYVTAGAWGLSADENAMYKPYGLEGAEGDACYTATYEAVPAEAFFSITVYGPEKYLMSNEDNIVSSTPNLTPNEDGSFSVAFGGEACRDLAPNYAATPEDGWSFLLRAYRPDVAAFQEYELPEIEAVE